MCDASLICLAPSKVFSMTIPAKVQSSMACGIPIIASVDGETQAIIEKSACGVYSNSGDCHGLYEMIRKMTALSKDRITSYNVCYTKLLRKS